MKRVNYHLTEKQIMELQKVGTKTGLSVAEIIRRSVDAYLDAYKEKNRSTRKKDEISRRP